MPRRKTGSGSQARNISLKRKRKTQITQFDIEDIARARRLVSHMLSRLEQGLSSTELTTKEQDKFLWGEKDNAISVLSKLTKMLLELIPAGQNFIEEDEEELTDDQITSEDLEIVQHLLKRFDGTQC